MKITSLDLPTSVEALQTAQEELPEAIAIEEVMTGMKTWVNPINHFHVIRLHRSADPKKRSKEWVEKTRAGMDTANWLREYELQWEALDGRPVYQNEWSHEFNVAKASIGWNPQLAVGRGWDFGLYPACLFAQLFPHSRLIVLRECIGQDIDTERFIYEVDRLSNEWFPDARFVEFVDPTGKNRVGTDGRTYTRLLAAKPLKAKKIYLGANAPAARRTAVIDFLSANVRGLPCMLIDPSCDILIKGFSGGYMYAYFQGTLKTKPDKNIFSHIHDALQYLCSKVKTVDMQRGADGVYYHPVEPRYGSGKKPSVAELVAREGR
jgi:hypothetical protein